MKYQRCCSHKKLVDFVYQKSLILQFHVFLLTTDNLCECHTTHSEMKYVIFWSKPVLHVSLKNSDILK